MYKIMRVPEKGKTPTSQSMDASFNGTPYKIDFSWGFSICAGITDSTPADGATFAEADVNVGTNVITLASHGMNTGLKVQFTTVGTLPSPLVTATDYYVISVTSGTFKLATSLSNALANTAIDLTDDGTGTFVIDVQDVLSGTLKLQASNNAFADRTNNETRSDAIWVDIPSSSTTLTGGSTQTFWNVSEAHYEAVRIVWTRTVGQGSMDIYFVAKGEG
jgi:hypothetical protein